MAALCYYPNYRDTRKGAQSFYLYAAPTELWIAMDMFLTIKMSLLRSLYARFFSPNPQPPTLHFV